MRYYWYYHFISSVASPSVVATFKVNHDPFLVISFWTHQFQTWGLRNSSSKYYTSKWLPGCMWNNPLCMWNNPLRLISSSLRSGLFPPPKRREEIGLAVKWCYRCSPCENWKYEGHIIYNTLDTFFHLQYFAVMAPDQFYMVINVYFW